MGRIMSFVYSDDYSLSKGSFPCLYGHTIAAGFPSSGDDHCEGALDLNEFLIKRPASTFFVRALDNDMSQYGICNGDLLIIDRSLKGREGSIILIRYQEEQLIRKLSYKNGRPFIVAHQIGSPCYVQEICSELEIIGVVKTVIRSFKV